MSRDFTKDTANIMNLGAGNGAVSLDCSGASAISIAAWALADTFSTGAVTNNRIISLSLDTGIGLEINVDAMGSPDVMRLTGRSVTTDANQVESGTTSITTGSFFHYVGVFDFANDTTRGYLNGALEIDAGSAYGNSTYTPGTPGAPDRIGRTSQNTTAVNAWDGLIAEVAIWSTDIGLAGAQGLFKTGPYGLAPLLVSSTALVGYWRLFGTQSPEPDPINGNDGTITGTINGSTNHPSIVTNVPLMMFDVPGDMMIGRRYV